MKTMTKFLAATAVALAMAATTAAQAAVYISFDGTTDAFVEPLDGDFNVVFGALGGFDSVLVQGNAATVGDGILHSTAVEVTAASTAANLTVWITRTDFSTLLPSVFFSSTNNNNSAGLTSTVEQFYSLANLKYTGTSLGSITKSGLGGNNLQGFAGGIGPGTYSLTQKYTLVADVGGAQRSLSPTALAVAVPEPGTWALMIMGFGGAGALLRSRRRSNALTA